MMSANTDTSSRQEPQIYSATPSEQAYTLYLLQTCFGISYDGSSNNNSNSNEQATTTGSGGGTSCTTTIDNFKISGRHAVPFLSKSGLSRGILRHVWTLGDPSNVGSLTSLSQLHCILRIIAILQRQQQQKQQQHQGSSPVLENAWSSSVDAMKQCLLDTARDPAIPLAVFDGIPVPPRDELQAIYVMHQTRNTATTSQGAAGGVGVGTSMSMSSNSSVSSYNSSSGGGQQFAPYNNYIATSGHIHHHSMDAFQGLAAVPTSGGHFHHRSMDHHAFPGPVGGGHNQFSPHVGASTSSASAPMISSSMSIGSTSSSVVASGPMNVFAAASAGGPGAASPVMMSQMAGRMQHNHQNLNSSSVFGGFNSTTTPDSTPSLAEPPSSLMSVSDAFGDLVVGHTTTMVLPDLSPDLPSHGLTTATTSSATKRTAPSFGMNLHDRGVEGDDDDFGDFADASPTATAAAADTDTTTTAITGNPNELETPILSMSSASWGGPAFATTAAAAPTTAIAVTDASGWDALDALASSDLPTVGLQHGTPAPPPPFPSMTDALSWDAGMLLSSSSPAAAAIAPPPPFQDHTVISSSSTACSNNSVASGWDALDDLAESSSTTNLPGSVMSIPSTTATPIEATPVPSSRPTQESMNHVDDDEDDDDDFGDFNSGMTLSAPSPVGGEGQGFSQQGQRHEATVTMTPEISEALDVLDIQEPERSEDYHTSFLPEQSAPTVSGWDALDALVDTSVQDAPLPGLSALSMGTQVGESLEVQEDHQPSVGISQNIDEYDFSGFMNADVSEPLPPVSDSGTDQTPERVGGNDEEEFGGFSNDSDAQLSKPVPASAFRSDNTISSGEVVAGGETGVRGVSFSPAFDRGAAEGETTRPPLPNQGAFNKSERSDSAYYSARSYSMNSAAMSSNYSLDEFIDAVQSMDDSNNGANTNTTTPNAGINAASAIPPASEICDDPFAALDALSAPPPQLPPLSSFTATVPPDTSNLNVAHNSVSNDEGEVSESGLIMTDPSAATAAPTQDDVGSVLTHGDGSLNHTASFGADEFGAFVSSTDGHIPDGSSAAPETIIAGTLSTCTQSLEMTSHDMVEASEGTDFGDFVAAPVSDSGDAAKATLGDELGSSPDRVEISETDDFGDFETADGEEKASDAGRGMEAPAAMIPEQEAAEASEGTDGFGDFEAAPFEANVTQGIDVGSSDSDDFGDFDAFSGPTSSIATATMVVLPPAPATNTSFGLSAASFDGANGGTDNIVTSHTSEGQDDGWDAFQSSASTDTGNLDPTPSSSPPSDAERDKLLQIREKIVAQSLRLPEGIRRKSGAAGELVDFGDCFKANIGMDFPVSMERKRRMSRCLQLLDEIFNQPKLAATYWAEVISTARDELAMGSFLLDEGLSLSTHDQKRVAQPLEGYVHGLGECVRVVRCIAATLGDLLMLDPSALLTLDTLGSSWCGIPLLKDALEVEKLWESISDKSKKMGLVDKQSLSHKLESLVQIRSAGTPDDTNSNNSSPMLCQLSLQPLSLLKDLQSTTKAVVVWGRRHFMACSANFLANKCAFYSVR
jgi:hypothetical protein